MAEASKGRRTIEAFAAIHMDPTLSDAEKTLWGLYRSYDWKGRGAFPGDDRIAGHMGCAVRTVKRHRKALVKRGYLQQKRRKQAAAVYRAVLPEWLAALIEECADDPGGLAETLANRDAVEALQPKPSPPKARTAKGRDPEPAVRPEARPPLTKEEQADLDAWVESWIMGEDGSDGADSPGGGDGAYDDRGAPILPF